MMMYVQKYPLPVSINIENVANYALTVYCCVILCILLVVKLLYNLDVDMLFLLIFESVLLLSFKIGMAACLLVKLNHLRKFSVC